MTQLSLSTSAPATTTAQVLVVPIQPGRGKAVEVATTSLPAAVRRKISDAARSVGAAGKSGDITTLPGMPGIKANRIIAVGLGDKAKQMDDEAMRRAFGNALRACFGERKVVVALPDGPAEAAIWGARMGAYAFTAFKSKDGKEPPAQIVYADPSAAAELKDVIATVSTIADAVDLTRDLVNTPPNALPPAELANRAKQALQDLPVKIKIWDEKSLKADGCGGILAVGQGSANPPRLVRMEYAPRGATCHLAFVGKGITFDTGGISIKPAANMDEMKGDMAGSAAVIGAMQAIATLGLPVKVTGWVALAENMPSGTAQRPGDVITMFDGTTVEVLNTDAEGRLVLGDALGMAVLEKPDLIVDAATLTGAQRIALGSRTAGVMSNDDAARTTVVETGTRAGEALWPMPLPEDLRASLDSPTADIANIGDRLGGMLSAGLFLQTFIPTGQPWVHVDIAGPAFNDKSPYGYTPKGGTGAMVRTFVQLALECAAD
jgi:leucyl aminopeptidase